MCPDCTKAGPNSRSLGLGGILAAELRRRKEKDPNVDPSTSRAARRLVAVPAATDNHGEEAKPQQETNFTQEGAVLVLFFWVLFSVGVVVTCRRKALAFLVCVLGLVLQVAVCTGVCCSTPRVVQFFD